ncbi:MAG: hypothetical protein U0872_16120 [Planctomycetaceae bacterium]
MSIALDLGTAQFRSLRRQGDRLIARACSARYAIAQDNPARRNQLTGRRVPFAVDDHLVLFGDDAEQWAQAWGMIPIPVCLNGRLQVDDRIVRQVVSALIEALLPFPERPQEVCCLTMPGDISLRDRPVMDFITAVLRNIGYLPQFASQGLAVALAELSGCGLTGVGMNLGIAQADFSIVRHGRELARCRIPLGFGENFSANPADKAVLTPHRLREILAAASFEWNRHPDWRALPLPISVAVSGGITTLPNFDDLLRSSIQHANWPFPVQTIRIAADPQWAVGRGCLIQAELEELTTVISPAA